MTPELKRFNAACELDGTLGPAPKKELAKRMHKSVRALHRALSEENFSRPLRERLIKYTDRVLAKNEIRRGA